MDGTVHLVHTSNHLKNLVKQITNKTKTKTKLRQTKTFQGCLDIKRQKIRFKWFSLLTEMIFTNDQLAIPVKIKVPICLITG